MKETRSRRWISLLLTAVMLLSLIPAAVMPAAAANKTEDSYHRILHLDCGRKYFTKDWIKALINEMEDAGYNQLQLAFGNDGLRFLLDDMSFTANGKTYSHATVVSKVEAGNKAQNSSGDERWLTQTEMDEIIAYANDKNIEIIPLLNLPGHANAILDIVDDAYNASGSDNTLDVANSDKAVEFGYAIFQKYVDYFAKQGCQYFNFGADEYANDASGTFSFSRLNSTQYQTFVKFINQLASYIEGKGMTPRAFNDGLYYNGQSANIDTDIQCCYWSSGWGSYPVASASTISGNGHKMINTNGDYYYVLGKNDAFTPGNTTAHDPNLYTAAESFNNSTFMSSTISNPAGSMFCIWCDFPNAETETEVAQKTRLVLRAMAARMQDHSIDTINTEVVSGGFNADGTINTTGGAAESATVTDGTTNVTVTAPGLTSVAVTAGTASESNGVVSKTYSITLNGGTYTGKATVKIPYDTAFNGYTTLYGMAGSDRFDVTVENGYFVCAVPHFSDVTLYGEDRAVSNDGQTISIEVGKTETIELTNYTGEDGSQTTGDSNIATATVNTTTTPGSTTYERVTSLSAGTYYVSTSANDTNPTVTLTLESAGNGTYYLKNSSGSYIYPDASYISIVVTGWWSYSLKNGEQAVKVGSGNGGYTFSRSVTSGTNSATAYLTLSNNGSFGASGTATTLYLYKQVTQAGTSTSTLTVTGVGEGTTTANVGGTTYTINVTAPKTEETKTLNFGNTLTLPDGATDVKVEGTVVTYANGKITAGQTAGTATVTFVTKNAGGRVTARYTYTINVTEVDLSTVTPLTIEYWITNAQVTANDANEMTVAAKDAYSENGVAVEALVPNKGTKETNEVAYWKTVKLEASSNNAATHSGHQTRQAADDETRTDSTVTRVRYWNGSWQVLVKDQWATVDQTTVNYSYTLDSQTYPVSKASTQIVAYYMQVTDVTDEVQTQVVDWGPQKAEWSGLNYLNTKYVLLDYSVKYEDGTETPSTFPTDKSLAFHCDVTTRYDGTYYRDLGQIRAFENGDYEVYLITVTPSKDSASSTLSGSTAAGNTSYTYQGTETVAWAATQQDLENSQLGEYSSITGAYKCNIGGEPRVDGLEIYQRHAMKVTYYVRTVSTEQLTVHYMNGAPGNASQFYEYGIGVKSGTTFKATIALASPWKGDLANGTVTNDLGKTQTVSADLSTMPGIGAQYRYVDYTCTQVVRSEDGKDVYLYYTFSNQVSFVVDFGLPMMIAPSTVNSSLSNANITEVKVTNNDPHGTATVNGSNVTYMPNGKFAGAENGETFTITYSGNNLSGNKDSVSYVVNIIPASNVLYEDSFLKVNTETGNNYAAWTAQPTQATNTQQAQKAGETGYVFGYDTAYASSTGNSMNSAWTINNLTSGNASKYLTTTFYGTGFDLIGTAGPNTGYVYLLLQGPANKLVIIDTSYAHGTLSQVPLAHLEGLTEGTYTVNIRAAYRAATASTTSTASTYGMNSSDPMEDVYAVMEELYQDGFEIDDIEVVGVDEAAAASTLSAETATRAAASAGTTVTIDGFRVYRSSNNESYPEAEKNVTYVNVLSNTLDNNGTFKAYTESGSTWEEKDTYESNGGPQNEVYLANGNAIAFKVDANAKVQISARAVSGAAKMTVNGETVNLNSNTEMYYEVTPKGGIVTISNEDDAMVALGNLKLPAGTATAALTAEDEPAVFALLRMTSAPAEPEGPETSVFTPEKLDINVKSLNVIRNKLVTLTITTSTDVASLTVNGKTLKPTNSWLVKKGWSDEYVYVLADKVKRNENKAYEVIAYNADGTASAAKTVNG